MSRHITTTASGTRCRRRGRSRGRSRSDRRRDSTRFGYRVVTRQQLLRLSLGVLTLDHLIDDSLRW